MSTHSVIRGTKLRVLGAVIAGGPLSEARIARKVGIGRTSTGRYLRELRDAGLIEWQDGAHGTVRATCLFVPARDL